MVLIHRRGRWPLMFASLAPSREPLGDLALLVDGKPWMLISKVPSSPSISSHAQEQSHSDYFALETASTGRDEEDAEFQGNTQGLKGHNRLCEDNLGGLEAALDERNVEYAESRV